MTDTTIYTIPEFKKELAENKYNHIGLFDSNGTQIVSFNNIKNTTVAKKLQEIDRKLKSKQVKDGFYTIRCKNAISGSVPTEDYVVQKGEPTEEPSLSENVGVNPNVRTYQEVLDMTVKIQGLERDKKDLEKDVTQHKADHLVLQAKADALEDEVEQLKADKVTLEEEMEESQLEEVGEDKLEGYLSIASPFIERYFDNQAEKLKHEKIRLHQEAVRLGQTPNPNGQGHDPNKKPQNKEAVTLALQRVEEYINSKRDDEELFQEWSEHYNEADNLNDFFKRVQEWDQEQFEELVAYINKDA